MEFSLSSPYHAYMKGWNNCVLGCKDYFTVDGRFHRFESKAVLFAHLNILS